MRILLVDDSLTIRSLLRRTLAELLTAETAEAANGVEALMQLARRRFDLVVLDVNMPVMGGVETLEAIRTTPEYAGVPVVMLTSEKNEPLVRRLVELGITAYLSKPLSQDVLAERLSKILRRLQEPAPARPPSPRSGRRMMVVEQDPDRRHFLLDAVSRHYEVAEADSAASALMACLASPPPILDYVLVGPSVGLPPVEMFVARLRALPHLASTRLIACVAKGEAVADRRRPLFDVLLESCLVPDVFLADLERAIGGTQSPLARILLVRSTLARDLSSATEQVFGMMLSSELEASVPEGPRASRWSGAAIYSSIGLVVEGKAVLTLLFRADPDSARIIAARMIGVPAAEVQDGDVLSSGAELSNIVLGRLRNRLVEAGFHAQVQLPRIWTGDIGSAASLDDPHAIDVAFRSASLGASFELLVHAKAMAPGDGPK